MNRPKISVEPREDRQTEGTKAEREHRLPLAFRIRYAVVMAAFLTVAVGAGVAIHNTDRIDALSNRLARDEHQTCVIQARGLPAGHELAASMSDIHRLLTVRPATPAQRRRAAQTPPAVRRVVDDLNMHLSTYQRLEAKQPATRSC